VSRIEQSGRVSLRRTNPPMKGGPAPEEEEEQEEEMYSSHAISSPTCFDTPHVPSLGVFVVVNHNAIQLSVV